MRTLNMWIMQGGSSCLCPVSNGAGFPLSSDGLLPLIRRAIGFFGIIHVFSFSIRRSRHNGWDRRYFSRNLQGGPVVPFGEVATLFIHVFPFLSGGGVTPPRPRYFCILLCLLPFALYILFFIFYFLFPPPACRGVAERVEVPKGEDPGTTLSVAQKNPVKKNTLIKCS
jgi:hypothetical protein